MSAESRTVHWVMATGYWMKGAFLSL